MGSFKVKLVAYFVLLSLLPLAAAFWGFSTVAARSETRRVDAGLQAGLRASLAAYQDELGAADVAAVGQRGARGAVVASVPLDQVLVSRLEDRSGLEGDEHIILVEDRRIVAGPHTALGTRFDVVSGKTQTLTLAGTRYRTIVADTL